MESKEIGYNARDYRIALGIVLLKSREKAAEFAGVAVRTVYNRLDTNGKWISEAMAILEECLVQRRRDVEEVAAEQWLKKYEKVWAKAFSVAEEEIEKGNYAAARDILRTAEDRRFGKPTSTIRVEGEVKHKLIPINPQVERVVEGIEKLAMDSADFYLPPSAEEAELVGSGPNQGKAKG